ncbi:MAG: hypothetical protein ABW033_00860 [Acidimicrobiia bacterium]
MSISMRDRLQAGLLAAMKAKDPTAVKALRSTLAAIANAEAVAATLRPAGADHPIAGSVRGLGAGDVSRRALSELDVVDIVDTGIAERVEHARQYDALDQTTAADQLRAEAAVLQSYLAS